MRPHIIEFTKNNKNYLIKVYCYEYELGVYLNQIINFHSVILAVYS